MDKFDKPSTSLDVAARPADARTSRYAPRNIFASLLLLATCLALSVAGWRYTDQLTTELAAERFEFRATEITMAIVDRVEAYELALRGGLALFASVGGVSRDQWRDYVGKLNLLRNYPGIQGMGYAEVVPPEDVQKHVARLRREGFPEYQIHPDGQRPEYTAIVFLEPFDQRNRRAFGFDMFSEPTRHAAMVRARDTGQTTISGRVTLVQETDKEVQSGFLMYLPFYRPGAPAYTDSERRAALLGYVYSPFRMNNFMQGIVGKTISDLGLEVHDGTAKTEQNLMYRSQARAEDLATARKPMFTSSRNLTVFGRSWLLSFNSLPSFEATLDRTMPLLVLGGGVCISLLLFLIVLSLMSTRARALALANVMTVELRESGEKIRLLLESTGEPIYGIDTNGLCTFCNPACVRVLGYKNAEELLGKNMHALIHHTHKDGSAFDIHDCHIFQAFQLGQGTHVDDEVLWRADGTSFQAEYWSYPQLRDGQIVGAVVTFQDITERRRAEADSAKLAGLVNAASQVSIIATDTEGLITVFNHGAENMLGYSAAEMVGLRSPQIIHLEREVLEHGQRLTEQMGRPVEGFDVFVALAREGGFEVRQWTYVRKDGSHVPVELVVTAIRDRHDDIIGFLGIGVDISARMQAEQALSRSEKRFRDLADLSPVGIYETDAEGNCLFVNKRWQEFAGLSLEQALGQGWVSAIHPDDVGKVFSEWQESTRDKRDFVLEYRFKTPEGKVTWLMGSATASLDDTDTVQGFFGSVMDIGTRMQAETALRESQARLAAVLDTAVDPIFTVSQFGRILTANQAACRTFGYSLEELVGNNVNMLQPEPYHSQHDGYLERYARTGVPHILGKGGREVPGKRKDGVIIPLELAVSEIVTSGERLYTGILRDISEQVRAREEMQAANEALAKGENFLKAVTNNIPGLVGYWNADLRCEFANNAYLDWFGKPSHEVVGMRMQDLLGPDLFARNEKFVMGALRGVPQHFERVLTKADGSQHHTLAHYIPDVHDDEVRGFFVLVNDVTEMKTAKLELEERQRLIDADMEAAAQIQRSLLPKEGTCSLGIETDYRFMPSASIGGDIFNVVCLGPQHTALYMVDVSGHGIPAALVSVTLAQELSPSGDLLMDKFLGQPRSPDAVLRLLDSAFPIERFDKFFSMFYMLYEADSGTLTYCNAGHPPPMLLRSDGRTELLEEGGTLVGMGMGQGYRTGRTTIDDGDMLLVFTDGVTELESPAGEQYGEEQLWEEFSVHIGRPPEDVLNALTGKLQSHAEGRPPDDDISLVCARFSRI
jgi:PAS domain S-box-containing protein